MIQILTKHLTEHLNRGYDREYRTRCSCGATFDSPYDHAAHVAATFQAALDAAGATTRTEWGIVPGGDNPVTHLLREEYARHVSATQGVPVVSRTVVTMPWQPAEEVEA